MAKKKRSNPEQICPYCAGKNGLPVTQDHVIPRCVFVKPYPPNMITVPVCKQCNGEKGADDTFLRDIIAIDYAAQDHPAVKALLKKMLRANSKNRSDVGKIVRKSTPRKLRIRTPSGIYLPEPGYELEVGSEDRYHRMFQRIVQGLLYYRTKKLIPLSFDFEAGRVNLDTQTWKRFSQLQLRGGQKGDAVQYVCSLAAEDQLSSVWIITFYGVVHFTVSAINPALASPESS